MKARSLELKRWRRLMPAGGAAHVARVTLTPGRISRVHTHDFAEIFWVERGTIRHEVDGTVQLLSAGALVGIRPVRRHRLDAPAGGSGVIFNLAFPIARLRALEAAHPGALARLFGREGAPCPVLMLPEAGLLEMRSAGDTLLARPPGELETDYRLLQALRWAEPESASPSPAMPDWLARGLAGVASPDRWSRGLAALHRACGRSPAQVARVMRATMGTSPIAHLNALRMEHAERQLRLGSRPIVDIAAECGFAGLSQFYRLFVARHGKSPLRYRRHHQGSVR